MISSFVLGHCSNFMVTFHLSAASVIFLGFVWGGVGVCVGGDVFFFCFFVFIYLFFFYYYYFIYLLLLFKKMQPCLYIAL